VAYYQDRAPCDYHVGAHSHSEWNCPLEAIGWLEHPNPVPIGVAPAGLSDNVRRLAVDFRNAFPAILLRRLHECSLCRANGEAVVCLEGSHVNLFIPTKRAVLVAPARIDHYWSLKRFSKLLIPLTPTPGSSPVRSASPSSCKSVVRSTGRGRGERDAARIARSP
jgi:hypothetical protein